MSATSLYMNDMTLNTSASTYASTSHKATAIKDIGCTSIRSHKHSITHIATQINDIHPDIKVEGIHRKQSNTYPTTLIIFKTSNATTQNLLLNHSIQINQSTSKITKYIPNPMHKLSEAWSPPETIQASTTLCEMCRIFLPPTTAKAHPGNVRTVDKIIHHHTKTAICSNILNIHKRTSPTNCKKRTQTLSHHHTT